MYLTDYANRKHLSLDKVEKLNGRKVGCACTD